VKACLSELAVCVLLIFSAVTALAVDPTHLISQYGHTSWRIQDGFFTGPAISVAQANDGYIWIGTADGLLRFDGLHFVPFDPGKDQQLPSSKIISLLASRDGSLWIGTDQGLSRWANQRLVNLDAQVAVTAIIEDRKGSIWYLRYHPNLTHKSDFCQIIDTAPRCYEIHISSVFPLIQDSLGDFWIGGDVGVVHWQPNSSKAYDVKGLRTNSGVEGVTGLAVDPDGGMWVGMGVSGRGLGLERLVEGSWRPVVAPGFNGATLSVTTLFVDLRGALWVGTLQQGIYRIYRGRVEHFNSVDGLSGNYVLRFYEDHEGNLWVATTKGVDLFHDFSVVTFSTHEGLSTEEVDSVFASRDGRIWVGGAEGLDALRGDKLSSIRTGKGLPGSQVEAIFEDRASQLWVGIDDDLFILKDGSFRKIKRPDGSSMGGAVGFAEDVDGNIWVESLYKTVRTLSRIRDYRVQEAFPAPQMPAARRIVADPKIGLWLGLMNGDLAWLKNGRAETFHSVRNPSSQEGYVRQLIVAPDGSVLGATPFGLVGWKDGKTQTLTVRNGLPCDTVYTVIADGSSNLWLYAQCGLLEIARDQVQTWWQHAETIVHPKVLDVFDGAQPGAAPFPAVARSADGRLWFGNGSVLQMVDPAHLAENTLAPAVHVQEVVADRKNYSPQDGLRIPPLTRDLEIDYTALSFAVPQKIHFRYKLEGRDVGWQDAGTRRQAFYTDLRPRKYQFHVIACNNSGVWNEEGATLDFSVEPAWYQTRAFLALCICSAVLLVFVLYRIRVRQVAKTLSARFDERLAERTRMARELHDTFLQTVQGSKLVADDALEKSDDPSQMQRALRQLSEWLGRAAQEGRAALNSLRSSTTERNDLAEAFRRAVEDCRRNTSIEAGFSVTGNAREMHPVVRDEIYRIAYEAIRNACKHSAGSRVDVALSYADDLSVRVRDNGVGMDAVVAETGRDGHFGLQGMRERAARIGGRLTVTSSANSGTEVRLVVPGRIVFRKPRATAFDKITAALKRVDN
jgi:signal transduction histidine kinase/ligand-binding sensor domain-containing protein